MFSLRNFLFYILSFIKCTQSYDTLENLVKSGKVSYGVILACNDKQSVVLKENFYRKYELLDNNIKNHFNKLKNTKSKTVKIRIKQDYFNSHHIKTLINITMGKDPGVKTIDDFFFLLAMLDYFSIYEQHISNICQNIFKFVFLKCDEDAILKYFHDNDAFYEHTSVPEDYENSSTNTNLNGTVDAISKDGLGKRKNIKNRIINCLMNEVLRTLKLGVAVDDELLSINNSIADDMDINKIDLSKISGIKIYKTDYIDRCKESLFNITIILFHYCIQEIFFYNNFKTLIFKNKNKKLLLHVRSSKPFNNVFILRYNVFFTGISILLKSNRIRNKLERLSIKLDEETPYDFLNLISGLGKLKKLRLVLYGIKAGGLIKIFTIDGIRTKLDELKFLRTNTISRNEAIELSKVENLKYLNISCQDFPIYAFNKILGGKKIQNTLESLILSKFQRLTDENAKIISNLKCLEVLKMQLSELSQEAMGFLFQSVKLQNSIRNFCFDGNEIGHSKNLEMFSNFKKLENISLGSCRGDRGEKSILQILQCKNFHKSVKYLRFIDTNITLDHCKNIASDFKNIECLVFISCSIESEGLDIIFGSRNVQLYLKSLSFQKLNSMKKKHFELIANFESLKTMKIVDCSYIREECIDILLKSEKLQKTIENILMHKMTRLPFSDLTAFRRFHSLKTLDLSSCQLTGDNLEIILSDEKLYSSLRLLNLNYTDKLEYRHAKLITGFKKIKELLLNHCKLSKDAIDCILNSKNLQNTLEHLNICGANELKSESLNLITKFSCLKSLDLMEIEIFADNDFLELMYVSGNKARLLFAE